MTLIDNDIPPSISKANVLLICPQFFGYHEALLGAARRLGVANIGWVDARVSTALSYKAGLKIAPDAVRRATQARMRAAIRAACDLISLTHIVIIKGDGMTPETLGWLRTQAPSARVTFYVWDSTENAPGATALAALSDARVTFDSHDAARLGWHFHPLFSRKPLRDPQIPDAASSETYDWCFVGSVHGDRHAVLERFANNHPELSFFTHCFVQSMATKFARALRDPGLLRPRHVPLMTQVLSPDAYADVISRSKAVVDVEHASQRGLTMRSIETLLSGVKLITTNQAIAQSDLYHPDRVQIVQRADPHIDSAFLDRPFPRIPPEIGRAYEVEPWMGRLLFPESLD